jgi:hypothetical protein
MMCYARDGQVRLPGYGIFTRTTPVEYTTWVDDMFMGIPFLVQASQYCSDPAESGASCWTMLPARHWNSTPGMGRGGAALHARSLFRQSGEAAALVTLQRWASLGDERGADGAAGEHPVTRTFA